MTIQSSMDWSWLTASSIVISMGLVGVGGLFLWKFLQRRPLLNKGKGKAAAQCCHAVIEVYKEAQRRQPKILERWESFGQPKVTLKVEGEGELNELVSKARRVGLLAQSIRDAGRTQLAAGTKTVAAIGPGPVTLIDSITGHLKLY